MLAKLRSSASEPFNVHVDMYLVTRNREGYWCTRYMYITFSLATPLSQGCLGHAPQKFCGIFFLPFFIPTVLDNNQLNIA